ncbi:hypothetical protein DFP73DRAFT_592876 [Morchella snyderi]|nr:hypothetical protein DFP73DRAFT_592876 [Morchella snyderi]
MNHRIFDGSHWISFNITAVLGRETETSSNWTHGGTTFTGLVFNGRKDKFLVDLPGIESYTVWRRRGKGIRNAPRRSGNTSRPEWCYLDVVPDSDGRNRTLWMTEGRLFPGNEHFSDSILTILEQGPSLSNTYLWVCSTSAALKTATASSGGWSADLEFSPDLSISHDTLSYYENGDMTKVRPEQILYHKNWLDSMIEPRDIYGPYIRVAPRLTGPQGKYTSRAQSKGTNSTNTVLTQYVEGVPNSIKSQQNNVLLATHSHLLELRIGGTYLSLLLYMPPSATQYTGVPSQTRNGEPILAGHLMPEPILDYTRQRPSSRCCRNTCAGIGLDKTLSQIIKIKNTGEEHLELVILAPGDTVDRLVVDKANQYGYLGVNEGVIGKEEERLK